MKNQTETNVNEKIGGGVNWYRKKIVEMIESIENIDYLEFIYNMMIAFKEKWGI